MSDRISRALKRLDCDLSEIRERTRSLTAASQRLDDEAASITQELHRVQESNALSISEDLHQLSPMEWEAFKEIPSQPVGTPTEESFQSAAEMHIDPIPSDRSSAHTTPFRPLESKNSINPLAAGIPVTTVSMTDENFSDSGMRRCDSRGDDRVRMDFEVDVSLDSAVYNGMIDMMKTMDRDREERDKRLADMYLDSKQGVPLVDGVLMEFRWPKTEYEEWQELVGIWGEEELIEMWRRIPDMRNEKRTKGFIDRNRLIKDPVGDAMKDFRERPWSEEEKQIFVDKYAEHPKDFYEIAKWLPNRSTGDCVQFFYTNRNTELFIPGRRKRQLKKRRLQSESNKESYNHLSRPVGRPKSGFKASAEQQKIEQVVDWFRLKLSDHDAEFSDTELVSAVQKFGQDATERDLQGM